MRPHIRFAQDLCRQRTTQPPRTLLQRAAQLHFNDFVFNYQYPFPFQVHWIGIWLVRTCISHLAFCRALESCVLDWQPFATSLESSERRFGPVGGKCFQRQLFVLTPKRPEPSSCSQIAFQVEAGALSRCPRRRTGALKCTASLSVPVSVSVSGKLQTVSRAGYCVHMAAAQSVSTLRFFYVCRCFSLNTQARRINDGQTRMRMSLNHSLPLHRNQLDGFSNQLFFCFLLWQ